MPEQLPADFSTWQLSDAQRAVTDAVTGSVGIGGYTANRAYVVDQDHWQNGTTWPAGGTNAAIRTLVLTGVKPQFVAVDVIQEVLDGVVSGVLKTEADIQFTPIEPAGDDTPEAEAQAEEAGAMLDLISGWCDKNKFWERARNATRYSRWATRGLFAVWIPRGKLIAREGGFVLPADLDRGEALDNIVLSAPEPNTAVVYEHPDTKEKIAVVTYKDDKDRDTAELWYVDDAGNTVVRTLGGGSEVPDTFSLQLGGFLPVGQMKAPLLITPAVRQQQNRLNFFETLLIRIAETAGFPERVTINSAPEGRWLTTAPTDNPDALTKVKDGVTYYLHAIPRTLGPAMTTELRGYEYDTDDQGGKGLTTPSIVYKEPTDPEYLIRAADHARRTILRSCKQGHMSSEGEVQLSGIAYEQARARFVDDLTATKGPLEGMLRDIIAVAIALAEAMGPQLAKGQSFLDRFRVVVNVHLHPGPVSPEQQAINSQKVKDGLLSRESCMAMDGVEDVAAELERIDAGEAARLAREKQLAEVVGVWTTAGIGLEAAAKRVGLTDEEITELLKSGFVEPDDENKQAA